VPDVSGKTHAQILDALDRARQDVISLRNTTQPMKGYMGFELVETLLIDCRAAIEALKDQGQIVTMLKRANGALKMYGGGDVAPVVERTRQTLKTLWKGLEPKV
jgi:hypothetical protein